MFYLERNSTRVRKCMEDQAIANTAYDESGRLHTRVRFENGGSSG
jgi:hypothetical protein